MSSENTKKRRASRSLAIALILLAVLLAPIVVFQSKLRTIGDIYAESGFAGVYYQAKDLWPWASPNVNWDAADPASQGVDSTKLKKLWQRMDSANTQAFLVAINNQIVFEKYGSGGEVNRRISSAAMGKAITAGLVLLVAMDDELVALDDFMHEYVSSWKSHDDKQKITIRHLVTHESGLDDVPFGSKELSGWKKKYYDNPAKRFRMSIDIVPLIFEPGTGFGYSGVGFYALAYALAVRYKSFSEPNLKKLISKRVMDPLGIPQHDWSISYGQAYQVDGISMYALGSGGNYTARAVARIGQLLLDGGQHNNRQLVSSKSVAEMMSYGGLPLQQQALVRHPASGGIGTWSNCNDYWPSLPRDAVLILGAMHSFLLIVPSRDLVVVRMGGPLPRENEEQAHWQVLDSAVFADLSEAVGAIEPPATPIGCDVR